MRSQETRLGAMAAELDEWSRTLPVDPIRVQSGGPLRQPTVRIAACSRLADCLDGTVELNSFSTRSSEGVGRGSVDSALIAADRIVAGRYHLRTLLGTGGMGAVWLAEDAVLRRAVALKKLTHEEREDQPGALQEARAAASISHPGVLRVHDVVLEE